jgi:hypothetical protein
MLKSAFNLLLSVHGIQVTIKRLGTPDISASVKVAASNYFRNLEAPSETVIRGREFIISKEALDLVGFPKPLRGDRIVHPESGTLIISEVIEMNDIGSVVIGYRVRTG